MDHLHNQKSINIKQNNKQIPQEKINKDSDETKLFKQNIISSLKSDFLETKYNKICAIYEDDDDLELTKQIKSPVTKDTNNNTHQLKMEKSNLPNKQEQNIYNIETIKNKNHQSSQSQPNKKLTNSAQVQDVESKNINNQISMTEQVSENDTIEDKTKTISQESQISNSQQKVDKYRFHHGLSQTLSRQQSRTKQNSNSIQKLTLKNLLDSNKGSLLNLNQQPIHSSQPFSQSYTQQMYSNRQDVNSRQLKNMNHSQSLHKLQSPKQSSCDNSQHNYNNYNNFNNGKIFPFSTRNSIATPFNELDKQYCGILGRKDSNNLSIQVQQNIKKNENSQSAPRGFKSQKNKLSSMLLSQKQINDIEEIRKNKKSDFYIQLNSFDNQSPLDPKKNVLDIEKSVASNKFVSEFNTNTSAGTNSNNYAFNLQSNSKKQVQSSSKNIQDQNKMHHKTLSNFSQAFNQQIASFIGNEQFNPSDIK
ncbi:hypothetical protein ABPG74_003486 [Tetrahymena malaccensis]